MMISIRFLRAGNPRRQPILTKRNATTGAGAGAGAGALPLLYRDVLLFDDAWTDKTWCSALEAPKANLRLPTSNHVIARYSQYMFNNSQYHFNSVGEFSLNIAASHIYSGGTSNQTGTQTGTHTVVIWPDQIVLRGLTDRHIPAVVKAALDPTPLTKSAAEHALGSTSSAFPSMMVVCACVGSPGFSLDRAKQTLDMFRSSSAERPTTLKPVLVLAEELRYHRTGTHVLLLPSTPESTESPSQEEASYELQLALSKEKIQRLLSKY